MNGAQVIIRTLEGLGVECTFGMPGSQNLELFDALSDSKIRNILVTNELFAAFMADGYGRATGKTGVCLTIPGPGITNMITGLAEANADSSAMVVIVPGFGKPDKAFNVHQIRQAELLRPIVKEVFTISDAASIQKEICRAFELAQSQEPGPVVLEIDKNLFNRPAEFRRDYGPRRQQECRARDTAKINKLARMLIEAGQCGIYAGAGALSASEEIKQLAELLSAPVATTVSGRGAIPEDRPLSLGFGFGPSGSRIAEEVFKQCDLVLALGCKFSQMATGNWGMNIKGRLIQINTDRQVFNKNYPAELTLCQDVKTALKEILALIEGNKRPGNNRLMKKIAAYKLKARDISRRPAGKGAVLPSKFFYRLRGMLDRNAILATDCGNHQLWALSEFAVFSPRTFITPADYQAMGFGIPAAIGAKIGSPDKQVVCVCGDGGFLISGLEILTALREKLNLVIVIFNDGALGLIKQLQERIYRRSSSVDLVPPDYRKFAESLGCQYLRISADGQLAGSLRQALLNKKIVLVDVKTEYRQLPQYIKGIGQSAWNGLSAWKKIGSIIKFIGRNISGRL